MLAISSSCKEREHKNVVQSTSAVIFLGTPHRGSLDVAALGEVVRSLISTLGMETTPAILDSLGLKTTDLERAQEEFSRLWQRYDFRVKTFQEGLNLAKLGRKVVPDYSSLIGDYREYAETLQANHMEMCRYSGIDDPNYRKVAGELHSIYHATARMTKHKLGQTRRTPPGEPGLLSEKPATATKKSQENLGSLQCLWFPAINIRLQSLGEPAERTCHWLFEHGLYQDWFHGRNKENHRGLLWLKGKPGTGKSILMREAFRRAALGQAKSQYQAAAFFFSAKGDKLEHSLTGLFRSLLYQLLPGDSKSLRSFHEILDAKRLSGGIKPKTFPWNELELESIFQSIFYKWTKKRTMIFVDALDECDSNDIRHIAFFFRQVTILADKVGGDLSVCLSSRHFPSITVCECPEIIVEEHNSHDIATYVEQRFQLGIATQEEQWELLRDIILKKSSGVFLWVILVVDEVLRDWDDGKDIQYLTKRLKNVPDALKALFSDIFSNLSVETRNFTVRLFQWAILAIKPLRLHEWYHIMAFIGEPTPSSLVEWQRSHNFIRNDDQLERQIRSVSRGLVEVTKIKSDDPQDVDTEKMSLHAGAGSFNLEHGDTRIVQVIHESVRGFFLGSDGFCILDPFLKPDPISKGHLSIMATCLDYLNITELDALVQARTRAGRQVRYRPTKGFPDVATSDSTDSSCLGASAMYQGRLPDNAPAPCQKPTFETGTPNVFEMLRSSDPYPKIDVIKWMADDMSLSDGSVPPSERSFHSSTHFSDARRSQILEAHPALLSYAAFSMFRHARWVNVDVVDPTSIAKRLQDKATWARWIALREDVAQDTTLFEYVRDLSIYSWLPYITSGPRFRESAFIPRNLSHHPGYKPRRRPISVASFGSASSHDGR